MNELVEGELAEIRHGAMERAPKVVLDEAANASRALQEVISKKKKPVMINGEQYLEFEDWQTLGRFYGITVKEDGDPEFVTLGEASGFKASAVALDSRGQEVSRATAFCLSDEPKWKNRATFQLASMAQTRACAKALRNVLSWVAVLAGYRPTPAEEMGETAEKKSQKRSQKIEDIERDLTYWRAIYSEIATDDNGTFGDLQKAWLETPKDYQYLLVTDKDKAKAQIESRIKKGLAL